MFTAALGGVFGVLGFSLPPPWFTFVTGMLLENIFQLFMTLVSQLIINLYIPLINGA